MLDAPLVVVFTKSGFSARIVAAYRPNVSILVLSDQPRTYRQLALVWGVIPELVHHCDSYDEMMQRAKQVVVARQLALCVIDRDTQRIDRLILASDISVKLPTAAGIELRRLSEGREHIMLRIRLILIEPRNVCVVFRAPQVRGERRAGTRITRPPAEIVVHRINDRSDKSIDRQLLINGLVRVYAEIRLKSRSSSISDERPGTAGRGVTDGAEFVLVYLLELDAGLGVDKEITLQVEIKIVPDQSALGAPFPVHPIPSKLAPAGPDDR